MSEDAEQPFTREDFETVAFLAEQGSVAVENAVLHEEAERLSLTDGLTGVWNRRSNPRNAWDWCSASPATPSTMPGRSNC